jgi:hypothetical protein
MRCTLKKLSVDGKGVPAAPTTAFSLGNGPLPFNNPLLFVMFCLDPQK